MPQVPYTDDLYKLPDRVSAGGTEVLNVPNYGAMIGHGLEQFGQGAGAVGDLAFRMKRQDDVTAVQSAMNDLRDHGRNVQYGDPNTPDDRGFFGLQDKAALDAWKPTADGFQQYQKNLMGTLTADQQRLFAQESEPFMAGALNSLAGHAAGQRQRYQDGVQDATLTSLANSGAANSDNPAAFAGAYAQGKQNVIARNAALGYGADHPVTMAAIQKWGDTYFHTAVVTAAQKGDAISARNLLLSNQRSMSAPVFAQTMAAIRPEYEKQVGNNLANEVWNDHGGPQAVPVNADPAATMQNMLLAESGNRQKDKDGNTITSSKGAIGIAQMLPATAQETAEHVGIPWDENRFLHDENYNRALGTAYFHQLCDKYGNNQTLACAAYNAGPGKVDKWLQQYGDPRTGAVSDQQFVQAIPYAETQRYVSRVASSLSQNQPAPSATPPDLSTKLAQIHSVAQARGYGQEIEDHAVSRAMHNNSLWDMQTRTARASLHGQVNDLSTAYMDGNTQNQVPEAQIRSLYQPDEADRIVSDLNERRQAGLALNALKWATPAQVGSYMQASQNALGDANVDDFATRAQIQAHLQTAMNRRTESLKKDPAAYVQDNPQVQQAWQTYQQNKTPENLQAYADRMLSLQQTMGVSQPRFLTDQQAQGVNAKLTSIDPQKENVFPIIAGMKQQYGAQWRAVQSDLLANKLPHPYAMLLTMDDPSQSHASAFYQINASMGEKQLADAVNQSDYAALKGSDSKGYPIDNALTPFFNTLRQQSGGVAAISQLRDAVRLQALGYMKNGLPLNAAIGQAADDFVGKFDVSGTLRTPKGTMPTVQRGLQAFMQQATAKDVSPRGEAVLNASDTMGETLEKIKKYGFWINNADETGYQLVLPAKIAGRTPIPIKSPSGGIVTLSHKDIMAGRYIPARNDEGEVNALNQTLMSHPGHW